MKDSGKEEYTTPNAQHLWFMQMRQLRYTTPNAQHLWLMHPEVKVTEFQLYKIRGFKINLNMFLVSEVMSS